VAKVAKKSLKAEILKKAPLPFVRTDKKDCNENIQASATEILWENRRSFHR